MLAIHDSLLALIHIGYWKFTDTVPDFPDEHSIFFSNEPLCITTSIYLEDSNNYSESIVFVMLKMLFGLSICPQRSARRFSCMPVAIIF